MDRDKRTKRVDIEGVRALAILSVVIYHFFPDKLSGGFAGVDIFFVISGFIIISTVLRQISRDHHIDIKGFWGKRIRRLLPAVALVLFVSSIATYSVLPAMNRPTFGADIISASLYFINWRLGFRSVDYLAESVGHTPVEHFWSLAIEEQFYILVPLLILFILFVFKKRVQKFKIAFLVILIILSAASFMYSLWFTSFDASFSYFSTFSRFWELGIGSVLAVCISLVRRKRNGSELSSGSTNIKDKHMVIGGQFLTLIGIGAILASFFIYTPQTIWPSYPTLLPTFGVIAIITGGTLGIGVFSKMLGNRLFYFIGGISYSWYLWHFPILVIGDQIFGDFNDGLKFNCIILSLVLAIITKYFLEDPVRFNKQFLHSFTMTTSLAVSCVLIGVLGGGVLLIHGAQIAQNPMLAQYNDPSAIQSGTEIDSYPIFKTPALQGDDLSISPKKITPSPITADKDLPSSYAEGCSQTQAEDATDPKVCERGDRSSSDLVFVVGDSMAQQWDAALDEVGKKNHIAINLYAKSSCLFADAMLFVKTLQATQEARYESCYTWGKNVIEEAKKLKPVLVLSSTVSIKALDDPDDMTSTYSSEEAVERGMHSYWDELYAEGIKSGVIFKNPFPSFKGRVPVEDMLECTNMYLQDLKKCIADPDNSVAKSQQKAIDSYKTYKIDASINMYDLICFEAGCPPVVQDGKGGGITVYRQGSHLTDTYVRTISDIFGERFMVAYNSIAEPENK
ncbi:acyltransferase [Actinomycetota bacterium]|nr:acyltransferase [Actinomycetota bacterium]